MAINARKIERVIASHRQLEGGGFVVRRPFPTHGIDHVDPFLLLDEMGPVEYRPGEAVGAPDHPHRGFETVSYILEGEIEHEDSAGSRGSIEPGGVQWMTAGRGVVHSESPSARMQNSGGKMHGFQIWVNLPARDKMMAPRYQDVPAAKIPKATSADGLATVRVIAGEALGVRAVIDTRTPIVYQDWEIAPGGSIEQPVPSDYKAMVYVFQGSAEIGSDRREITDGELGILSSGDSVRISVPQNAKEGARMLLLGGQPLNEPVARYGPFVMNSEAEIRQAMVDYRAGRIGEIRRS